MRCHRCFICRLLLSFAVVLGSTLRADEPDESEELLAGHSHQGEAFNEGPRQAAYLMGGTGDVDFPITTTSDAAQAFFNQGVGQLHGYWYFEAERSFRQVAMIDPECAMAYWGMAQANVKNEERARGFIKRAYELREQVAGAERLHIEAYHRFLDEQNARQDKDRRLRYIKDLEQIVFEYPEQLEARAFIGNFFHLHYQAGVKPTSAQAYEDMLQVVLAKQPLHPVHHFRIHVWDDVNKPERGLDAAARCGPSAPSVAHMWHMPSHVYSKLHRYHDAAWHQEASARVDHLHMMRDRVLPDQIHNYAHNNEWLCRNLMNVGRVHDARALAANMVSLPRHPKYNMPTIYNCSSGYGYKRLTEVLTRFEMWDELVAAYQSSNFDRGETPHEQIEYLQALGTAQAHAGDHTAAAKTLAEFEGLIDELRASSEDSGEAAGEKAKRKKGGQNIKASEAKAAEIRGLLLLAKGDNEGALAEFEKVKHMDRFQLAVAYASAGKTEQALQIAESFVKQEPHQVLPAAHAAYLFEACGEHAKAEQVFDRLRHLAADADLDVPLFARLAPLAERLELPADWRIARTPAEDLGERPDLETLGPFRWSSMPADDWSLADHQGTTYNQAGFAGRPVVVVFYLGHGCLHCVEQLQAFAKDAQRFENLGIQLIGISSESAAQLQQAVDAFGTSGESIPFPLVCDPQHKTFRTYRCYDDFEDTPLHGTFLIDGQGKVRWHDISYEPFTDVDFLLTESQRLLGQDLPSSEGLSKR